ncbi:MAG: hypothetical protein JO269_09600 [Burkholderiaceae bacterium]|nr:hypothetical protein [Burkholderiaceae bacterium]
MALTTSGNQVVKRKYFIDAIFDIAGNLIGFEGQNAKPTYTSNDAAGSSSTVVPGSGMLALALPAAPATPTQPAATGSDYVLAVMTIPANAFDGLSIPSATNRMATILATGTLGATANNKTIKIVLNATNPVVGSALVGGTTIASSGVTASNGTVWIMEAQIVKYGAQNSNTQMAFHTGTQLGATVAAPTAPTTLTLTENAPITVAITGNAATATTDINFNLAQIEWNN